MRDAFMSAPRLWKLACLVLFFTTAAALYLWLKSEGDYSAAARLLSNDYFAMGSKAADSDFLGGRFRIYRLESGPMHFTGEKDGPFEIWTWPANRSGDSVRLDHLLASTYVANYNDRMRIVFARSGSSTNAATKPGN